jgi:hypothetical protein
MESGIDLMLVVREAGKKSITSTEDWFWTVTCQPFALTPQLTALAAGGVGVPANAG